MHIYVGLLKCKSNNILELSKSGFLFSKFAKHLITVTGRGYYWQHPFDLRSPVYIYTINTHIYIIYMRFKKQKRKLFSSVQFSHSVVSDSLRPHEPQHTRPPCPSPTPSPPKPMSIELMMPSNHPILCRLLLLPPSIFPSIKVFSNESALCIRWPEY